MEGEEKRTYLGAAISPFGVLPISIEEARVMLDALPGPLSRQLRFVGMDVDVVTHMRDHAEVEPVARATERQAAQPLHHARTPGDTPV